MKITFGDLRSVIAAHTPGDPTDGWITMTDKRGNALRILMDYQLAEAIEEAWVDWDNYEPTPPTYDEALATKCDAEARNDEAMKLKGIV